MITKAVVKTRRQATNVPLVFGSDSWVSFFRSKHSCINKLGVLITWIFKNHILSDPKETHQTSKLYGDRSVFQSFIYLDRYRLHPGNSVLNFLLFGQLYIPYGGSVNHRSTWSTSEALAMRSLFHNFNITTVRWNVLGLINIDLSMPKSTGDK